MLPRPSIEKAKLTTSGLSMWRHSRWEDVSASKYAFRTLLVGLNAILSTFLTCVVPSLMEQVENHKAKTNYFFHFLQTKKAGRG